MNAINFYPRFDDLAEPVRIPAKPRLPKSLIPRRTHGRLLPTTAFIMRNLGEGDMVRSGFPGREELQGVSIALAPEAKLWSFEPDEELFAYGAREIELFQLDNVVCHKMALSGRTGGPKNADTDERFVKLDDVLSHRRRVSILQFGAQDHDREALLGAQEIIHRWQPILMMEEFNKPRWIESIFGGLGYRLTGFINQHSIFTATNISV